MVVAFINDKILSTNLPETFTARIISNNITIWTGGLPIAKPKIEYYPEFAVLTGIKKLNGSNPSDLWFYYSANGIEYDRKYLQWKHGSNVYSFEVLKIIESYYFSGNACNVICHVSPVWMPLNYYITIVNDNDNSILRSVPYLLDHDLSSCIDLPVPGDSPSMFWIRIKELSLFNVTSVKFKVHIKGEGIECQRAGQKSIQVGTSAPTNNGQCSVDSDIAFCKHVSHTTNGTLTYCDVECVCMDLLKCSNVQIVMQSANRDPWKLCELDLNNV
ncbi:uncharacterized protein LOC117318154 [Pecten maximus]|uniref:uncharacterized protein LOC117318154 n=1 Tax=Pecten maximus TaxID=6579 RepID=UPI00145870F7|nr:uncharacterized protein LOC117318154 [Pecten maximus]